MKVFQPTTKYARSDLTQKAESWPRARSVPAEGGSFGTLILSLEVRLSDAV